MADRTSIRHGLHPNGQMNAIGWALGILLLLILLPLLPFFLVYYVADALVGFGGDDRAAREPTTTPPGH